MIAKRLREHAIRYANDYGYNVAHDLNKAADHIEALETALRPFARAAEVFDGFKGSYREPASRAICSFVPENFKGDIFDKKHPDLAPITYGDCRNARAALAPEQDK